MNFYLQLWKLHRIHLCPINKLGIQEGERKVEAPFIGLETKPVGANAQVTVAVGCSSLNPEAAE